MLATIDRCQCWEVKISNKTSILYHFFFQKCCEISITNSWPHRILNVQPYSGECSTKWSKWIGRAQVPQVARSKFLANFCSTTAAKCRIFPPYTELLSIFFTIILFTCLQVMYLRSWSFLKLIDMLYRIYMYVYTNFNYPSNVCLMLTTYTSAYVAYAVARLSTA